jgi:hypothetical protein
MEQLITQLNDREFIEEGYTYRDVALAVLVNFHQFDIARAIGENILLQQRKLEIENGNSVFLYPGISEEQYHTILHFSLRERWPFTGEGLFHRIQKQMPSLDTSLLDAFYLTPEFLTIHTLIHRAETPADSPVEKPDLVRMLSEGTWKMLADFVAQQRIVQDLSATRRQKFLLDYIDQKSPMAAYILLKTDYDFSLRKLDDTDTLRILRLIKEKKVIAEKYATALLISPRSDLIWQTAAQRLYEYAGEKPPEKHIYLSALARFTSSNPISTTPAPLSIEKKKTTEKIKVTTTSVPIQTTKTPHPSSPRFYIIQEGDSLWKIAHRFHVDIETLKNHNQLQSDLLKPGTTLKIP